MLLAAQKIRYSSNTLFDRTRGNMKEGAYEYNSANSKSDTNSGTEGLLFPGQAQYAQLGPDLPGHQFRAPHQRSVGAEVEGCLCISGKTFSDPYHNRGTKNKETHTDCLEPKRFVSLNAVS